MPAWLSPLQKSAGAEHDRAVCRPFGGVVAAETDTDPMAGGLAPVNAGADNDANPDGNSDMAAMQAVAAMISGRRGGPCKSRRPMPRHPVMPCWSMKTILLALMESLAKTRFRQPDDDWTDASSSKLVHLCQRPKHQL